MGGEEWIWVDRNKENKGRGRGVDMGGKDKENEGGGRGVDMGGQD